MDMCEHHTLEIFHMASHSVELDPCIFCVARQGRPTVSYHMDTFLEAWARMDKGFFQKWMVVKRTSQRMNACDKHTRQI